MVKENKKFNIDWIMLLVFNEWKVNYGQKFISLISSEFLEMNVIVKS